MRKSTFALLALLIAGLVTPSAEAGFMNFTCTKSGTKGIALKNKKPADRQGTAGVVDPRRIDVYKLKFASGEHTVAVQPLNGDVDIQVCKYNPKTKKYRSVCESGNIPGVVDTCLMKDDTNGQNPGVGPPLRGSGTYKLFIWNCFASPPCGAAANDAPMAYIATWQ